MLKWQNHGELFGNCCNTCLSTCWMPSKANFPKLPPWPIAMTWAINDTKFCYFKPNWFWCHQHYHGKAHFLSVPLPLSSFCLRPGFLISNNKHIHLPHLMPCWFEVHAKLVGIRSNLSTNNLNKNANDDTGRSHLTYTKSGLGLAYPCWPICTLKNFNTTAKSELGWWHNSLCCTRN